jgi:hypothetical protein
MGLNRQYHCYQRWHLGGKIRLDRAPEMAVNRPGQHTMLECGNRDGVADPQTFALSAGTLAFGATSPFAMASAEVGSPPT